MHTQPRGANAPRLEIVMPENVTPPHEPLIESTSGTAPALVPDAAPIVSEPEHGIANPAVLALPPASSPALPPALPPEAHAMLELVARGLAPDADESTRRAARELWARFADVMTAPAPVTPAMPAAPLMPIPPAMPTVPAMPTSPVPTSPIAMAARALRQMPPDQLLDLALQRLRAALPPDATVPTPRGIQFQLVPVMPPPGSR
jgi:hypothetical protein